jgi:hypothetical protein
MRKEVQEALESAIAGFKKRQQAEQERLRERERFETDWAQIRTAVVLPALEEVAVVLRKAVWQCEVRAGDKDPGVRRLPVSITKTSSGADSRHEAESAHHST